MAKNDKLLIPFRGSNEYDAFLDDLLAAVQVRHPEVRSRSEMAELAIGRLAKAYSMTPPPRVKPIGYNRFTERGEGGGKESGKKSE